MYHSYSPEYLKDLTENYEEYISKQVILDDLSFESKVETEYLKIVEKAHLAKTE